MKQKGQTLQWEKKEEERNKEKEEEETLLGAEGHFKVKQLLSYITLRPAGV